MTVYILGGSRTPLGSLLGNLSQVHAAKLGATAIIGALGKAQLAPASSSVDQVIMGNVIQAGVGQAPARQAGIFAGLPDSVPCTTVNKVCGSGMESVILGAQSIMTGDCSLVVSGGMENMSMAPHILNVRVPYKLGSVEMKDSMQWDGLWDVYTQRSMGACAEECVKKYGFTRAQQDQFAIQSFQKAQTAINDGSFNDEITAVEIKGPKGKDSLRVEKDEGPFKANFEKIPVLSPVFQSDGTITAATASTINDGAAAVVLGGESYRSRAQFKIKAFARAAQESTWFTTAPVIAMKKCLEKTGLKFSDIDLFEINEAFAVVVLAAIKECSLDPSRVNVWGGAIALGHPIGCSGTRILVTLMNAMKRKGARLGMASICIGGGEALSMVIESI